MDESRQHSRDAGADGAAPAAIRVRGLVKRYGGRAVVDGVSFDVRPGEVFALLGPNGAGKTTTVEILEGYRKPDDGQVRVLGLDPLRDGSRLKPRIGLMLQQGGLYPHITALEALRLFSTFYADPEPPDDLLDRLDLRDAAGTRFRRLTGGQKPRLSLGLALVGKPELDFLDEPTAAMDPQARRATWEIIRELRTRGVTVLLTTHFMDEAEQLADRVAIVDHGHLVALDTPVGLRHGASDEVRFTTSFPVEPADVAAALGLPARSASREANGTIVLLCQPTPVLLARLTAWLAERDILIADLHAGSRTLEQAFLSITGSEVEA